MTPVLRSAARVLVIDADDRLLLLRGTDPVRPQWAIWHAPGGGIDPGENADEAARRELAEEVGLSVGDLGPVVWTRNVQFSFDGTAYDQHEVFFVHRVATHLVDTSGHSELERRSITDNRWFTIDELQASKDLMAPPDLPARMTELLRDGPPANPVEVAGAVIP